MVQPFSALSRVSVLREGLKQALFDQAFAALLLFDIDHFRQICQIEGQVAGDQIVGLIKRFIAERGWVIYGLETDMVATVLSQEQTWDEAFPGDLSRFLKAQSGVSATVSGGGVRHPASEFALYPTMANLLLDTAHTLLLLAKKRGRNRVIWLDDGANADVDLMQIDRDYYREMARIQMVLARRLEQESRTDFLTGLHNRRGFEEAFARMVQRSRTSKKSLALMYMDSDSLKTINDARGHDAGDRFIAALAQVLNDALRGSDLVSRWGADEFAIVVENTTREEALAIARRLNKMVASRTEGTISMGVYFGIPESAEDALKKADEALYRVKRRGKNDVELVE